MKGRENGGERGKERKKEREKKERTGAREGNRPKEREEMAVTKEEKRGNGRKGKGRRALDVVVVALPEAVLFYFVFPEIPRIRAAEFGSSSTIARVMLSGQLLTRTREKGAGVTT